MSEIKSLRALKKIENSIFKPDKKYFKKMGAYYGNGLFIVGIESDRTKAILKDLAEARKSGYTHIAKDTAEGL